MMALNSNVNCPKINRFHSTSGVYIQIAQCLAKHIVITLNDTDVQSGSDANVELLQIAVAVSPSMHTLTGYVPCPQGSRAGIIVMLSL